VLGGISATAGNLAHMAGVVPSGSTWGVIAISREQWTMVGAAAALGGNVRVGFEDNFYLPSGQMASSNGELVEAAANLCASTAARWPSRPRPGGSSLAPRRAGPVPGRRGPIVGEVLSEMVANVWKVVVGPGDAVAEGDPLVILESMKMEIPVASPVAGVVSEVRVREGGVVQEGDVIAIIA
jgi:acetyl-CoA carboxylase biotin carboxyl carrier protein